jgi:hypothetical protein
MTPSLLPVKHQACDCRWMPGAPRSALLVWLQAEAACPQATCPSAPCVSTPLGAPLLTAWGACVRQRELVARLQAEAGRREARAEAEAQAWAQRCEGLRQGLTAQEARSAALEAQVASRPTMQQVCGNLLAPLFRCPHTCRFAGCMITLQTGSDELVCMDCARESAHPLTFVAEHMRSLFHLSTAPCRNAGRNCMEQQLVVFQDEMTSRSWNLKLCRRLSAVHAHDTIAASGRAPLGL